MNEPARKILNRAMRIPVPQRAEVAAELLASLDGEPDSDVEAAWAAEIERRIQRIQSGEAGGRAWAEVRERLDRRDQ
ncbi:MAG: addiction module component, family protein [Candidatus Eisenbacteria bacterium]|nr:addiction module component, family protein [Candidatus Eisenbacteria bacterium]